MIFRELFLRVNGLQQENEHGYTQVKEEEHLPLRHHIKCGTCGKPLTGYIVRKKELFYYNCNKIGCRLNRNASKMQNLYQDLLKHYQVTPVLLPQVQEAMEQVF
ncbi:zinc ribbon domain-containing protein [Rufibacter glacialis]|uniref:Zinc ribbon domain-containing protein n=1 Tax=Rufibacter glacialis TaxID=1259555 RepID=A0A5M8QBL4_9BACT|nr:zinc ribbon domain-containing protein [Rufibacter glacialis]KAA6432538.1 hypothetical protein FOE74_15725 [Rufibacter glacialis]